LPLIPENLTDTGCGIIFTCANEVKPHSKRPESKHFMALFLILQIWAKPGKFINFR
jgi:hypothetical protein